MNATNRIPKWNQITNHPSFQEAPAEERAKIRDAYFNDFVAPELGLDMRDRPSAYMEWKQRTDASLEPPPGPGFLRRTMDAVGGAAGAARERLTPEPPLYDEGAWREVVDSETFQQGDTRARHDLRQQFFRDNIAGDLEGEARRQAERDFYSSPAADIRGTLEGSGWQPGHQRGGVDAWESGSTGRRPGESMEAARDRASQISQPDEDGQIGLDQELIRGLQNAGRGVAASFYGSRAMMTGDEEERDRLLGEARRLNEASMDNQGSVPGFTDIRSPSDAVRWYTHALGAMAPSVGTIMAGGAAGGKAGAVAGSLGGPKGATLGAIAGSTIGSFSAGYGLYAGGLYSDIRDQGGDHEESRSAALKWGAPASAVSIVLPMGFLASVTGYLGKDFVRNRARNMAAGAGLGLVGEGTAEGLAETFTIMGEEEVLGRTMSDEDRRARILNAAAAGGVMGQAMGTIGGGVQQRGDIDTMIDGFIADMETAYTEGASEEVRQATIATLESAESLTDNQQAMLDYLRTETADRNRPLNRELAEVQEIALGVHQRDDTANLERFTELSRKQAEGRVSGTEGLELIALQVNSPGVRDMLAQEAQYQAEGGAAAQPGGEQTVQPDPGATEAEAPSAEWEQAWREQGVEKPADFTPQTLDIQPGAQAEQAPQATPAQAAAAEADQLSNLLRSDPAQLDPGAARARDNMAMGDGFEFLWQRADGDRSATEALTRMQSSYLESQQADTPEAAASAREEAARAYGDATAIINANQRRGAQQERKQGAIEAARQQAAAEGGDALTQTLAGEQAEAEANAISQQENAADPIYRPAPQRSPLAGQQMPIGPGSAEGAPAQQAAMAPMDTAAVADQQAQTPQEVVQQDADLAPRLDAAMATADSLAQRSRDAGQQAGNRQRNLNAVISRAETAFEQGNLEQAGRLLDRADSIAGNLEASLADAVPATAQPDAALPDTGTAEPAIQPAQPAQPTQGAGAQDGLTYRSNGEPFATQSSAMASGIARRGQAQGQQVEAVPVDGGFAVRVQDAAQDGAAPAATEQDAAQSLRGEPIDSEWTAFSGTSGTLGIPRAEMPQIKAEHRGALANFLGARGIVSSEETVPAASLQPTQAEFSEQRVAAAKEREGGDRAILVSQDGHVIDGHHQWLARADQGEDVRVIRLDATTEQVLEAAREFPSSEGDTPGSTAARGGEPAGSQVPPRTASAPAERDAPGGRAAAAEGSSGQEALRYRASGEPFASEQSAMASGIARRAQSQGRQVEAVPVEGGFAVRVRPEAQQAETAQRRQESDQGQGGRDDASAESPAGNITDTDATQSMARGQDSLFSTREQPAEGAPQASEVASLLEGAPELADTRVIQSTRELPPEALMGMILRGVNPTDVRGMFVGGDLYVIADNLESAGEGVRVAVHEAVGHKGVRGVLGEDLVPVMRQVYRSLPMDSRGREALNEVLRDYPFLDRNNADHQVTIAEEMIAHLAEKGWNPGPVRRAIAKIRELLRRYFPNMRWTDADVMALAERSREYLRRQQADLDSEGALMSMAENLEGLTAQQMAEQLRDAHPGLTLDLMGREGRATVSRIVVPDNGREVGTGTQVMRHLARWADANGITLALTPSSDFGGNTHRLREFYQRFGFVENKGRSRDFEISESMYREPGADAEARFSMSERGAPTANQVRESLQGIEGLGQPAVLESAAQLDLDTGMRLTLRGLDPQSVVAFHDDSGRLQVIAGNAESAEAAVNAAVAERVRQNGLKAVVGDRVTTVTNRAYGQIAAGNKAGRQTLRAVRAEFTYLDPSLPQDRASLALEVAARLNERGTPPDFVNTMLEEVRRLLGETHGVTDTTNLARANRAYLTRMQRDFGGKAPPEYQFGLDLTDAPGYGTLTDLQTNLVDADGRPIDDMRVERAWTLNPARGAYRAFVMSQSDRLRETGNRVLVELGNRLDRAKDAEERRSGRVRSILRPAIQEMQKGGRAQRKQNLRDFEQYWRDRENGRQAKARETYERNPAVAAMVDAASEMFHQTGLKNQTVKTPSRTGVWVKDGQQYRRIGKIPKGQFWPRVMRPEVSEAIRNPNAEPALWDQLVSALVDAGMAKDKQQAGTWLRDHQREVYSPEGTNDFYATMEKARSVQLPEVFYDFSIDVVMDYGHQWARRISQIEHYGQKLRPTDKDAWDEAFSMATDQKTKDYIGEVSQVAYGARNLGAVGKFMRNTNVLATGLHLTNFATASQNLVSGSGHNASIFGGRRMARAYAELARDHKAVAERGIELGILGKDYLSLIRDADRGRMMGDGESGHASAFAKLMEKISGKRISAEEGLREFTKWGMKWGGYNATEQTIRAGAMVAAEFQLADALDVWNKKPNSATARKYRRIMRQNRLDVDALIRENGRGEETARYLRLMVNLPQGSYQADMVPLIFDTEYGKYFGKYGKFGTQASRTFWQQKMGPMLQLFADPNATGQDRAMAFADVMSYSGWALFSGYMNRWVRNTLFGMAFAGADLDEVWDRFTDGEFLLAASLLVNNLWNNAMSAGYLFGFFSSPMQAAMDYRDRARMRNPMDPPAWAAIEEAANLGTKFAQQGFRLTGSDLLDSAVRTYGFPRVAERTAATAADWAGVEPTGARIFDFQIERFQADMVRRDVNYIRVAAQRWADQEGIEARQSGSFSPGSTPNTPSNNRIHRAVQLGNQQQARELIREELSGLGIEEENRRLMSIRSALHARHPLRIAGKKMNQDERESFMRWAGQNLPPSRLETIQNTVQTYDNAMDNALWGW